jgi:hypothetical protein
MISRINNTVPHHLSSTILTIRVPPGKGWALLDDVVGRPSLFGAVTNLATLAVVLEHSNPGPLERLQLTSEHSLSGHTA